ncbi:MAG: SDR family NAD(P)-dependent oxidoreductase [Gemmatimonadaceae bacterium]|nr:SDR family NAD(P)-dependent oxidoreductase [Chitinophagaceae bacterium]
MTSSSGKSVIIVGATSGIGRELAALYLKAGCRIGITGRRQDLLETFQQEHKNSVVEKSCFDVCGNDNILQLEALVAKLGGLDLLIYNAGFGEVTDNLDFKTEKKTVDINVNGFVEIVGWAYNYFLRLGSGQIAATSSIASIRGNGLAPAYSASKAFMSIYMEGLFIRSSKTRANIFITDIQPGFVDTKAAKGNKRFWVAPVAKATQQIYRAIESKKRKIYVTQRWKLIAWLLKAMPVSVYKRI